MEQQTDFEKMVEILKTAQDYLLLDEVIYSALKEMKENPNLTPSEAAENACSEWIK